MCDGSFFQGGIMLCTECFSYEEQLRLCKVIKNKLNIDCSPNKYGDKYRIYIWKTSMDQLKK